MSTPPTVTVLLPVYNGAGYLEEALQSVLCQSWSDFELLVINDGSTDGSADVIKQVAGRDRRLRCISRENRGLVHTLNEGLDEARGRFIARMDADDVMHPQRLALQVAALAANPRAAACGSQIVQVDERVGIERPGHALPTAAADVQAMMLFRCTLLHPTVMLRKSALDSSRLRYDPSRLHIEDYVLFEALGRDYELINLPQPLLRYRKHADAITVRHAAIQAQAVRDFRSEMLQRLGLVPCPGDMDVHELLSRRQLRSDEQMQAALGWLRRIANANARSRVLDESALHRVTAHMLYFNLQRMGAAGFLPHVRAVLSGQLAVRHYLRLDGLRLLAKAGLRRP